MKPFKHEIQKKKWDKLRRRKLITSITIGGCSALVFAGAGVGVGYFVWHTKTNKTPDEIKPQLSFAKGGNNELSSTVEGNEKNTITLNASFNQPVWTAAIGLTSGYDDIFEDNYVNYSNDGGKTWLPANNGVNFWSENYQSSGSITFKLLKPYTDDKLVNFILVYCPKEHEPAIHSEKSASVLFLKENEVHRPGEEVRDLHFRLFSENAIISETNFLLQLFYQLGGFFTSSPLSSPPTNGEDAAKCLCKSVNAGGISNAASIAALIACENYILINTIANKNSLDNTVTFDLEIYFVQKNDNDDHFTFDFSQQWNKNGSPMDCPTLLAPFGASGLGCNSYVGVDKKFSNDDQNTTTPNFANTYLTVDSITNNVTGDTSSNSNRGAFLSLITQDLAKAIYKGVNGSPVTNSFPTWMFPNP